ncbi:MAG: putative Ig domain-containing protein, partial [Verrucomicrobiales bacterium]|nr:putative Ig domain-containing protein [Verrucomicrobiales bacterium]
MLAAAAPQAQAYLGGFEDADGYYNGVAGGIKPPDVAVYNAGEYGTNPGGTGPGGAYTPMPLNSGLWTALAYGAFLDPSTNDESYVVGHEGGNSGASSLAFNNFGGAGELHYTYAFDSRDFGVLPTSVTDGTVTLDFDLCPVWGTGLPAGAYHTMNFKGANGATALSVASYADGTANSNYYTNVGTWVDSGINSNTAGWDHVTITFTLSSSANDKVTLSYTSSISGITTTVLNNVNVANNIDSLALLDFTQVQGANKYYYDNYLVSAAVPCELTVLVPAVSPCSTCPSITMSPVTLPNGTVGTPYSQTLTASGGVAPYTFAVTTGSLPAGLSLNTSTGAITGTPTSTSAASFIITVTDSTGCNASNSFTVTPACPVITVTPNPLSSGTVGTAYSASPSASGGIAPYTWSATGLPAGLSINPSTGAITGTPTASGSATITATDANGCFNSTTLTINPFSCPIITVTPNPLASGTVGTAYSASPVASGAPGGSSYTWTSVGLPAGLTLNATTGAISGTPTATGNATITATYEGPGGEQC